MRRPLVAPMLALLLPSSCPLLAAGPIIHGAPMVKAPASGDAISFTDMSPPTNPSYTKLRDPDGTFHAARVKGREHQGVDLILSEEERQCLARLPELPIPAFEIYAVASGTVVYAQQNGDKDVPSFDKGLGFTVIIDHGDDLFSLYAHLAQDVNQNKCLPPDLVAQGATQVVKVGQRVTAGDIIGYLGRTIHPEDAASPYYPSYDGPSGNALRTEQPIQLHFEFFLAASCAPGCKPALISDLVPPAGRGQLDPTPFLRKAGISQ